MSSILCRWFGIGCPPKPTPTRLRPVAIFIEGVEGAQIVLEGATQPTLTGQTDSTGWVRFPAVSAAENIGVANITRLNLHIDHPRFKHYDQYLDLPISRPDANPANWDVRIGGDWGEPRVNQLPPLPAMVSVSVPTSVAWPIHKDSHCLRQADGQIFRWLGLSAFQLYLMYLNGDKLDVISEWRKVTPGVTMLRVLGMVNSFAHLHPQEHPDYYDRLKPFADYLKERWNIGVEFVVFADASIIMPDRNQRNQHRDKVIAAFAGCSNVFIEAANEPNKDGSDGNMPGGNQEAHEHAVAMAGHGPLCTSGAGSDEAIAAGLAGPDYVTIHSPRTDDWYRRNKDVLDVRDQTGLTCVEDEPMGIAEVDKPGSRTANVQECATAGAVAQLHGLGSTIHGDFGITCTPFGPVQSQCAKAWHDAAMWVPVDAQLAPFTRGAAENPCSWAYGPGVAAHDDNIDLRSYCKHGDFGHYLVQCHMPGQPYRDHISPCAGWAIEELGPSAGMAKMKQV